MPGCCVYNCTGRSEKGVRLFLVPKGPKNQTRREEWIKNINREDLPRHAYVCENHFTSDQFENNRADLRRLLRWDAVPTLFSHGKKSKQKPPSSIIDIRKRKKSRTTKTQTKESLLEKPPVDVSDKSENILDRLEIVLDYPKNISKRDETNPTDALELKRKLNVALKEVEKLKEENEVLRNQMRRIFNEDQINVLKWGKMTGRQWKVDTIKKAMNIYLACGTRGYEELRKHNYPLPGIRTLQKQAEKFESETTLDNLLFTKDELVEAQEKSFIVVVDGAESESGSVQSTLSTEEISDGAMTSASEEDTSEVDYPLHTH